MGIKQETNYEVIFNKFIQGSSTKELAKEFNLSRGAICGIVNKEKKNYY